MRRVFDLKLFDHFDWPLLGCTVLIILLGLITIFSATYDLPTASAFRLQLRWAGCGLVVAFAMVFFDYRLLERLAYPIYAGAILLLILVFFFGKTALGAQRWLNLGFFQLQPSELAKVALAIGLAKYFHASRQPRPYGVLGLFWPLVMAGIPFVIIIKQPDLGTALIVLAVAICMLLFLGIQTRVLVTSVLLVALALPLAWKFVLHDYQKQRVHTFLNPESDPLGKGYQIIQSKIAIGSGELTGKGYRKGTQSKLQFLPKQHTDFIFSSFAEEFGFLGSGFLLALYAAFALLGLSVAFTAKEKFGMMLALGLTAVIISQAVINLGMESGALPVVGVPLPFFSYGGTSFLASMAAVGLLLNISMRRFMF